MKIKGKYIVMISLLLTMVACGDDEPTSTPSQGGYESKRLMVEVVDYSPAPGQFVNIIPEYEEGDTREMMNQKATESLCNGDLISLGSWGGNVTIKLPQSLPNVEGKADFRVLGNAIYSNDASNAIRVGSSEPGIVLVMQDVNGNGKPDDKWYELCGNQTFNGVNNYEVTYYSPTADATDEQYIAWTTSNGESGYISRTPDHQQEYFPLWQWDFEFEELSFLARRLPDNGSYNSETKKFDLVCYDGYADSHPNNIEASMLDIDNAIDQEGNKVHIESIDFIRIYTGVLQSNGPLGECSTEVGAIEQIVYK